METGQPVVSAIAEHNRAQREYFERATKHTMVPRATPYLRRHVEAMLRFGGITPEERLIEIGCGMGRYTLLLAEMGYRVEGVELSPVLLDRLREFDGGRHNLPLYALDIMDAPAELTGRYDVVIACFALHHMHRLGECVRAMARLLRPGGRAVFLEPNPYNPLYYLQIALTRRMTWKGDKGIVKMRRSVIFHAMQEAGFRDLAVKRFGCLPPFITNRAWGGAAESVAESVCPPLVRPFQLFRGKLP